MSLVDVAHAADRGLGELAVVEALPPTVVDVARLLTRLGDPATLLLLVGAAYLLADRFGVPPARVATVVALAVGALALTLALKHALALPRPPGAGVDGYGFPSGHALGATVVYGGFAVLDVDRRRRWLAVPVIAVVAASRVVIGVHYLVDVLAGVALGVGYLAAALWVGPGPTPDRVADADVRRLFALAVALALLAFGVSVGRATVVTLGAAVGGWVGWRAVDRTTVIAGSTTRRVGAVVGLSLAVLVTRAVVVGDVPAPLAAVLASVVVALLLALPGGRVEKRRVSSR